ncbi:MFS transporter [Burkholderia sp. Leaf177]|uniref:CynX/NimT family MFS transporter n=1 Tax=Burkholderia sp. Leaf177 TaxID=1736287 RepID=UPI0006FE0F16|nr:CynX/NimT family MFS transporter [Burkholderia sp. Leaf177]KQR73738.1 MFS transporter [Burkholderia sp. Leaf177]
MNSQTSPVPNVARPALLVSGILLIAANLRAPFTGVAPLLGMIRANAGLTTTEAGMLITLPLLAFAIVSPFAARVAREYGLERSLFAALVLIGVGIAVRSTGTVWCLYLGTAVIGGGIALGNVLLPSLLKRDFSDRTATLTSAYALTMGVGAAIASVIAIPLARVFNSDWRLVIGAFIVVPIVTALIWLPQLGSRTSPSRDTATPPHGGDVWRSALAWQVTLFLGLNSFVYYVAVSWLPAILHDAGFSADKAGSLHGVLQLATAVPGLLLLPIVRKMKDQRMIAFLASITSALGLLGLLLAPSFAMVWIILFGLGAGATIILGLSFASLRASNSHQAAALSGMSQCVGYLLAAAGPPLVGRLHDASGNWNVALAICVVLCLVMALLGLFAGRAVHISSAPFRRTTAKVI